MESSHTSSTSPVARPLAHRLFLVVLFFAALVPRLAAIGRYVTPDEPGWVYRSILFREALLHGQWAETLTAGHPGVTTTWLGAAAISVQLWLQPASRAAYDWLLKMAWLAPDNAAAFDQLATFLDGGRVAVALVNSAGLVAIYWLVNRVFNRPVALLTAALLALDPFVAGLSGLLHVDGLMTTFAMLSLLGLAAIPAGDSRGWRMAAFAGCMAALALLSKTPALVLLPVTGLYLVLLFGLPRLRKRPELPPPSLRHFFAISAAWGLAFVLTLLLLLPALWASPLGVLTRTSSNANRHLEEALRPTFFLGEVAFNHGPAFYPLNLLLRLSPVVFAGLVLAGVLLLFQVGRHRRLPALPVWLFVLWPLLFVTVISMAAKKFDRYALPAVPPLILLAAMGWQQLRRLLYQGRAPAGRTFNAGAILLVLGQVLYLLRFWPFPLMAYNPLVGGPALASQVVTVGWGEATSSAGRWLEEQTAGEAALTVADSLPALAPFYSGPAALTGVDSLPYARYLVLTANSRQLDPVAFDALAASSELLHTLEFGGLEQGWVFARPDAEPLPDNLPPLATPVTFGGRAGLLGLEVVADAGRVRAGLQWQQLPQSNEPFNVSLTVRDLAGQVWAALEMPLLNEFYFYPPDWRPGETPQVWYEVDLPAGIPPGDYGLKVALFTTAGAQQLPVLGPDGTFQGVAFSSELFTVPAAPNPVSPAALSPAVRTSFTWLDGRLQLLGHEALPQTVINGGTLPLSLYWHATDSLPAGIEVALQLGEAEAIRLPLSQYPTEAWRPGETLAGKYELAVSPEMTAGSYPLSLAICTAGQCTGQTLGTVEVLATERLFTLPAGIETPLTYRFSGRAGETITLHGATLHTPQVLAGETISLTLYWQTDGRAGDLYTAFVHVVDAEGEIIAQGDQWPGGLPADTWAAGQVIVDRYAIMLPAGVPTGNYQIAVGLYTAVDGVRLPVTGAEVTDNRVLLPLTLQVSP